MKNLKRIGMSQFCADDHYEEMLGMVKPYGRHRGNGLLTIFPNCLKWSEMGFRLPWEEFE